MLPPSHVRRHELQQALCVVHMQPVASLGKHMDLHLHTMWPTCQLYHALYCVCIHHSCLSFA